MAYISLTELYISLAYPNFAFVNFQCCFLEFLLLFCFISRLHNCLITIRITVIINCSFRQMALANDSRRPKETADQNFDYMFKLLIIGNSSVGKTSFLFRYADNSFTSAFVSTVGIDFKVKTVFRQEKRVKLQIWASTAETVLPVHLQLILTCQNEDKLCNSLAAKHFAKMASFITRQENQQ